MNHESPEPLNPDCDYFQIEPYVALRSVQQFLTLRSAKQQTSAALFHTAATLFKDVWMHAYREGRIFFANSSGIEMADAYINLLPIDVDDYKAEFIVNVTPEIDDFIGVVAETDDDTPFNVVKRIIDFYVLVHERVITGDDQLWICGESKQIHAYIADYKLS